MENRLGQRIDKVEVGLSAVQNFLTGELYEFLLEDSKNKDEMLNELLEFYRGNGKKSNKSVVIVFDSIACELSINGINIPISRDTDEEDLCRVVFKNQNSTQRLWYIDEIVEEIGDQPESIPNWSKKLYQAARRLNCKVAVEVGLKNFLMYSFKAVSVNPVYLKKT
jgi:hypothetical protein